MTATAHDVLLGWLALPIPNELLAPEIDRLRATSDETGEAAPFLRRLLGATIGEQSTQPLPTPNTDFERALEMLARGERAVVETDRGARDLAVEGQTFVPSAAVMSVAGDLHSLSKSSAELSGAGVAGVLAAHATAWMCAHHSDILSPPAQAMLRDAVSGLVAGMPKRAIGQAFSALSRACVAQGRADIWQAQVQHLIDTHADSVPSDLAWWIAIRSFPVISRDSRWFRAARTREQSEQLLDLRNDPFDPVHTARLDLVRVDLAEAYSFNRDLDEEPWIVTVDRIMRDLISRLGIAGTDHALRQFSNLVVRSRVSHFERTQALEGWLQAAEELGKLEPETKEYVDSAIEAIGNETHAATDSVVEPATPAAEPDDVPAGVPVGLYSDDPIMRAAALESEFGGWAFSTAHPGQGDAFYGAVPALIEMFTRGIADESERVREASAIFARRLVYGYVVRNEFGPADEWERKILAATQGLTSPKCQRLRVQALWTASHPSEHFDASEAAAAEQQLDRELEGNYADYAVVYRAHVADRKAKRLEVGPERIRALEHVFELQREAVDNDEYENDDWHLKMRATAALTIKSCVVATDVGNLSGADPASIDRNTLNSLLLAGERFIAELPETLDTEDVEMLGPYLLDELRPMLPMLEGEEQARTARLVSAAESAVREHDPDTFAVLDVHARYIEAAVVFRGGDDAWRARGVEMFSEAFALGSALIDRGFGDSYRLATRSENRCDWLFRRCEAWESGSQDGTVRPYTLTTRAALDYLRYGFARLREDSGNTLNSLARMAAHPACFLTSEGPDEVREFYALLEPVLDRARDGADTIAAVKRHSKQAQKLGKKRGLFR